MKHLIKSPLVVTTKLVVALELFLRPGQRNFTCIGMLDVLNAVLPHIALDDVSRRLVATVLTYNDGEPLLIWIVFDE